MDRRILAAATAIVCVLSAAALTVCQDTSADGPVTYGPAPEMFDESTVIVKGDASLLDGNVDYVSAVPLWGEWLKVSLSPGVRASDVVPELRASGAFEYAGYDGMSYADIAVPSGKAGDGSDDTHLETMGVPEAWRILSSHGLGPGTRDVVVAILDTGMDITHPDLADAVWTNPGEIPGNGIDDDGNGFVDDVHGWDFAFDRNDVGDDFGHGTHVAGIIAAADDGTGMTGVSPGVTVMPVKVSMSSGIMTESATVAGLVYAVENGADIVNMSLGGYESGFMEDIVKEMKDRVVLVAAAGNDGACANPEHHLDHKYRFVSPAGRIGVLTVMNAVQGGGAIDDSSNYDDIPYGLFEYETYGIGDDVYSTVPGGGYEYMSGTSMAAPTVSGIAALLLSLEPDLEPAEVRAALACSGHIHPAGHDGETDAFNKLCDAGMALDHGDSPDIGIYGHRVHGDGAVAGGECSVGLGLVNRGFAASGVTCTITTADPFVGIMKNTVRFGDIPASCVVPGGYASGDAQAFRINITPDCPDGHMAELDVRAETAEGKTFSFSFGLEVRNLSSLPAEITSDTELSPVRGYTVDRDVTVAEGATLTFGPGCTLRFAELADGSMPTVRVDGKILFLGEEDNFSEIASDSTAEILLTSPEASAEFRFCKVQNVLAGSPGGGHIGFHGCLVELDCPGGTFRADVIEDTSVSGNVDVVSTGDAKASLFLTKKVDRVVMDPDGSMTDMLLAPVPDGHKTEFVFRNSISNLRVIELSVLSPDDLSFVTEGDGWYDHVYFPRSLRDISPFNNCNLEDMYLDRIWPHVSYGIFWDYETGEEFWGEAEAVDMCLTLFFSVPVTPTGEAESYVRCGELEIPALFNRMPDPTQWWGYVMLGSCITECDVLVCGHGFVSADHPYKAVPELTGTDPLAIRTDYVENSEIEVTDTAEGAKVVWDFDKSFMAESFRLYRSETADGEMELVTAVGIDYPGCYGLYFTDPDAEQGKTYWYAVTAVSPDGDETGMSVKARIDMSDRDAPMINHRELAERTAGEDLVLRFSVRDNLEVAGVSLMYRTDGTSGWVPAGLTEEDGRYTAAIPAEVLGDSVLEYYITATDGTNTSYVGGPEDPVVCKPVPSGDAYILAGAAALVLLSAMILLSYVRKR